MNNIFDKIYISTYLGSDRIGSCTEQLKKNNIENYEFVYGINYKDIDIGNYIKEKKCTQYLVNQLSSGGNNFTKRRLACYQTFSDIMNKTVENNYKIILFLEDDFFFCDNINEKVEELFKKLPLDWDLIRLGWETDVSNKKTNSNKLEFIKEIPDRGAMACVYNINTVKQILELGQIQSQAVDGFNYFLCNAFNELNHHKLRYSHLDKKKIKKNLICYRSSKLLISGASKNNDLTKKLFKATADKDFY